MYGFICAEAELMVSEPLFEGSRAQCLVCSYVVLDSAAALVVQDPGQWRKGISVFKTDSISIYYCRTKFTSKR